MDQESYISQRGVPDGLQFFQLSLAPSGDLVVTLNLCRLVPFLELARIGRAVFGVVHVKGRIVMKWIVTILAADRGIQAFCEAVSPARVSVQENEPVNGRQVCFGEVGRIS